MIPKGAFLRVVDNSGAKIAQVGCLLRDVVGPAAQPVLLACLELSMPLANRGGRASAPGVGMPHHACCPPHHACCAPPSIQVIWTRFQTAGVGNLVKVTVKEAKGGKVAKGQLKKAVVVETKKPTRRLNGSSFAYMRNSCVLVSEKGVPIGNRIRSMLGYEFLRPRWRRLSLLGKRLY